MNTFTFPTYTPISTLKKYSNPYNIEYSKNKGSNCKIIKFDNDFNKPLDDYLDVISGCMHVIFGNDFNQNIDNLPNNIEIIDLGKNFNQYINKYPLDLKIIKFGTNFNQPVENLPYGFKELIIEQGIDEGKFNQKLDNLQDFNNNNYGYVFSKSLKSTIRKIKIHCDSFNQPIDNLPNGLIDLEIRSVLFNQNLEHLPDTIKDLKIAGDFNYPLDNLPDSLNNLVLECDITYPLDNLPSNLSTLKIGLYTNFNIELNNLPDNLIYLHVGNGYDKPFQNLKEGLKYLVIGDLDGTCLTDFNFKIPSSLKKICVNTDSKTIKKIKNIFGEQISITNNIDNFESQILNEIHYVNSHLTINDIDDEYGTFNAEKKMLKRKRHLFEDMVVNNNLEKQLFCVKKLSIS